MGVTIKQEERAETEVEINAEYCFSQAAQILSGGARLMPGDPVAWAKEWRELGIAIDESA